MGKRYAIVGQGLAGSLLHYHLKKKGADCVVFESKQHSSSSKVAAGVINPISGRKFVLSWMYPELEDAFVKCYSEIDIMLDATEPFLIQKKIIRSIENVGLENSIYEQINSEEFGKYFDQDFHYEEVGRVFNPVFGYACINGYQLLTKRFIEDYETYLLRNGEYIDLEFDYKLLQTNYDRLQYLEHQFDHIIFCDGANVVNNKYFNHLPFNESKGEALFVKIPNLKVDYLIKNKLYFVNLREDVYWVGSGYEWEFEDEKPTLAVKQKLELQLAKILKVPFDVIDHIAAVRPTVRHRKPLLGTHSIDKKVHIFNGLGTKGSMLAPYFAVKMAEYLLDNGILQEDVDISKL